MVLSTSSGLCCCEHGWARHQLPLTTLHHQLQPINAPPYTFVQVGPLDEEREFFHWETISVPLAFAFSKMEFQRSKSCKDFPYFLEKKWRLRRWDEQEQQQQSHGAVDQPNTHIAEDESGDVPNGQLCVICPCGPPDVAQETRGG
ncbi:uncharacterized protein LOC104444586 isoform X2 [Eucalyptus grandis]|nr:uncharacterized protein LOC104444586 isoform X2 [Eucalyptus grandis]